MTAFLFPATQSRALARLLGESERSLYVLMAGGLLLALAGALGIGVCTADTSWITEGNEGSARVVHGLLGTLVLLGLALPTGLALLGRWAVRR